MSSRKLRFVIAIILITVSASGCRKIKEKEGLTHTVWRSKNGKIEGDCISAGETNFIIGTKRKEVPCTYDLGKTIKVVKTESNVTVYHELIIIDYKNDRVTLKKQDKTSQ